MTQGQVSARMKEKEPRVDVGMISRYEKGVCLPTRAQIEVLEEIYNQSRTELYKIEDLDLVGYQHLRRLGQSVCGRGECTPGETRTAWAV